MKSLLLFAASVFATAVLAQEVPSGFERVPESMVKGQTLIRSTYTIDAPDGWIWIHPAKETTSPGKPQPRPRFTVYDPITHAMFSVAEDVKVKNVTEKVMKLLGDGITHASEKMGVKVSDYTYIATSVPVPGSYRDTYTAILSDGVHYVISYNTSADMIVSMQLDSRTKDEPVQFTSFVQSFRRRT